MTPNPPSKSDTPVGNTSPTSHSSDLPASFGQAAVALIRPEIREWSRDELTRTAAWLLKAYYSGHLKEDLESTRHKDLLVCFLLDATTNHLTDDQLRVQLKTLFPLFVNLTATESKRIRLKL